MDRDEPNKSTTENTSYVKLSSQSAVLGADSIDAAHTLRAQRSHDSSEDQLLSAHHLPPLPWKITIAIALRRFWRWFLTPIGFLVTIYGLNVVAWGGMLFLLICNAAPAMCHPSCNDINSPRRIWIEIDSQILNALFCVTGFGLAPWRFRDLYWWVVWRCGRTDEARSVGIRRLAGIHRGWYRLPGSDSLAGSDSLDSNNPAVPIPPSRMPDPPLTGVYAPPTKPWKMSFLIWCNIWNTIFQACLAGCMWGLNRYNRPSWTTGLFIALAFIVAGMAGWTEFSEGRRVKKIEGAPMSEEERRARAQMSEKQRQLEMHEPC
ncbi:hypothetical protein T310_6982 [Rasamsonia emersonii CBS 393.64]|uniref:Alpha-L-rhamnosidase C n=1 Tax=Rasamsonia emersonii (strain ATCC 16479 / CBS 393.64 / IMI 116815) TaxID=1408163 RepID=A0A0F4YLE6_RASE3|nr:hypothetical protein T310_6982 [Rasamsonia emersonii CBS 393.64]KKA19059.1 hypothetical protein T310_6982 [Rasamsonia emersonii CBS 393.64]